LESPAFADKSRRSAPVIRVTGAEVEVGCVDAGLETTFEESGGTACTLCKPYTLGTLCPSIEQQNSESDRTKVKGRTGILRRKCALVFSAIPGVVRTAVEGYKQMVQYDFLGDYTSALLNGGGKRFGAQ
jgi:hypothetical protein